MFYNIIYPTGFLNQGGHKIFRISSILFVLGGIFIVIVAM